MVMWEMWPILMKISTYITMHCISFIKLCLHIPKEQKTFTLFHINHSHKMWVKLWTFVGLFLLQKCIKRKKEKRDTSSTLLIEDSPTKTKNINNKFRRKVTFDIALGAYELTFIFQIKKRLLSSLTLVIENSRVWEFN